MAKSKAKKAPRKQFTSPFLLVRIPLTTEEHLRLSNPPDMALVALMEGRATRQDLWTLWFRCASTLTIVRGKYPTHLADIELVCKWMESFWKQHYLVQSSTDIGCSLDELADLRMVIDFANEVQHETNREITLQAYKHAHDYCFKVAKALEPEMLKGLDNDKQRPGD